MMVDELKIALSVAGVASTFACAVLQFRGYLDRKIRLLMWSAVFFTGLTVHNVALFVTLFVLPSVDLRFARSIPALVGGACLVYGVVWDARKRSV